MGLGLPVAPAVHACPTLVTGAWFLCWHCLLEVVSTITVTLLARHWPKVWSVRKMWYIPSVWTNGFVLWRFCVSLLELTERSTCTGWLWVVVDHGWWMSHAALHTLRCSLFVSVVCCPFVAQDEPILCRSLLDRWIFTRVGGRRVIDHHSVACVCMVWHKW